MGAEEGVDGPGVAATGAAEHIRWHYPRSPRALDRRPVARHVPTSERRIRVVQPDGGPPRRKVHAPSGPQGRVLRERLLDRPASTIARVHGSDRPLGQADPDDDHDRQHHFRRTGRREESRLETHLPRYGAEVGKGGWETQIHPHLPIPLPSVRGAGSANGRRGGGLSDGQEDGRIPDHPGSGFTAQHRRRRADSNSGTFASTRAFADAQPEAEIHIQGAFRVSLGLVQGTIEPGSTGTTAKGAATGSSTGRRTGVGGQVLRQHSKRIPAGSESIRVYGEGAGADQLRTEGRSGGDHPDNPISVQGPRDGGTPGPFR